MLNLSLTLTFLSNNDFRNDPIFDLISFLVPFAVIFLASVHYCSFRMMSLQVYKLSLVALQLISEYAYRIVFKIRNNLTVAELHKTAFLKLNTFK